MSTANYRLVRALDQIDLRLRTIDLDLVPSAGGHQLAPGVAGGYLIVTLPPQHVLEPAPTTRTNGDRPAFGRDTLLVFRVDKTTPPMPFTVDGVLGALPKLNLVVKGGLDDTLPLPAPVLGEPAAALMAGAAQRRREGIAATVVERQRRAAARLPQPQPDVAPADAPRAAPAPDARVASAASAPAADAPNAVFGSETSLNLPFRLELTPRGGATVFTHAGKAVTREDRTELWHTRLGTLRADGRVVEGPTQLFVLQSRETTATQPPSWVNAVSDERIAGVLVRGVRDDLDDPDLNKPLDADQLMLSPLGAWLDVARESGPVSYRQRIAMGRDVVARSVQPGKLYPFGHSATLIITTERRFHPHNGELAVLTKREVITVKTPVRNVGSSTAAGRKMPWVTVRLLTRSTPAGKSKSFEGTAGKQLLVAGELFAFRCLGIDRGGRTCTFETPLVFVPDSADVEEVDHIVNRYRALPASDRTVALVGQTLTVAEPSAEAPEATDVVADSIVLNLAMESGSSTPRSTSDALTGKLPSLQKFVPALANTSLALNYAGAYVNNGFGQGNAGQVVLQLAANQSLKLLMADKAVTGGMVTPSFAMNAVSRLVGPVGGNLGTANAPGTLVSTGKVLVKDLLKQTVGDVKLLGVFSLVDLIGGDIELELAATNPARRVPQLITDAIDGISMPRFHWQADLFGGPKKDVPASDLTQNIGPVSGRLSAIGGTTAKLAIDVVTESEGPVTAPELHSTATCRVDNVALTMGAFGKDLVAVPFEHLEFKSRDGSKPDFDVALGKIEFFGVLAFVRSLAALIPQDGFNDPPALDITDEKITSSFALPLPRLAVGMFSIENITFSAALDLWFAKPPELALNFATFDNRFRLAVLCLGGGGYLGLAVSTRGLQRLDGALEFGAAVSVNLGVARGSVSVMGGVHFAYDAELGAMLSAYIEVNGEIEVLCLLEVGVRLLVMLTYNFDNGELKGRAELEARVKFLFFKKTVRVPFEYTLVGDAGGSTERARARAVPGARLPLPGFAEQMAPANWPAGTPQPWDIYCTAYA